MKNTKRWLALLLAACMTVSTASPGALGSVNVVQAAETEAQEAAQLNEKAIPRYSSVRITWNAEADHTYTIARADEENGTYTNLVTNAAGPEYVDETAGTGAVKYYKITDNTTNAVTAVFSNEKATGAEALAENAEFKWINDPANSVGSAGSFWNALPST